MAGGERTVAALGCILMICGGAVAGGSEGGWREASRRTTLKNDALQARFQSGLLYELKDVAAGKTLVSIHPAQLPGKPRLFGTGGIDLDACAVSQVKSETSVVTRFVSPDKTEWLLRWSIEPGAGDLVLRMSARRPEPIKQLRVLLFGCDIVEHALVTVSNLGVGAQVQAPWNGAFCGDPESDDCREIYVHPLVALFQGHGAGWFLEGRDPKIGPANLMARGKGKTATVGFVRRFAVPTKMPEMFEIRIRTYHGAWQDAVDPYVNWLEHDVGLVPLERKSPAWVKDIQTQSNVLPGDFAGLEALAKRLIPAKTFIGRRVNYRKYAMDVNWPNYEVPQTVRKWIKRAKDLGFRVGVHINSTGIDRSYPELIERFRPGLKVIGTGADGRKKYWGADGLRHLYCSPAYKPWREYLIQQLHEIVDSGVDAIHLDESHTPTGRFLIDGVTAIEGIMALEKEILEAYPHIALETEQFNPMNARYASFALSPQALGHPLSGYIFQRFIKFCPEGYLYSPTDERWMDAFASWGFMMPGADARREESWLQIARAYQDYDLVPASRLSRKPYQLSGLRGLGGVTAFFEKHARKRGLVVYQTGQPPRWFGTRHFGITSWSGPGALHNWPVYNGHTLMALDSKKSYTFDEKAVLPPDRFHITEIPKDFALYYDDYLDFRPEDVGHDAALDGSFFRVKCTGHGKITMYVPAGYLVFLDGVEVPVDGNTRLANATIAAAQDKFSVIWAFRKSDHKLSGKFVDLPWQTPPKQRNGHLVRRGDGFLNHVSGSGLIIGRFPKAKSIRLQGAYGMREESMMTTGDGVIRINGKEVVRVPAGTRPFKVHSFDVDVSAFAGQYALLEFTAAGKVRALALADWHNPRIVVEP